MVPTYLHMIILFGHNACVCPTDGRTDRQIERRIRCTL